MVLYYKNKYRGDFMNRIYCVIGKFAETTQFIEYRLGEVCENSEIIKEFGRHQVMTQKDYDQVVDDAAFLREQMSSMTFGRIIGTVRDSKSLSEDEVNQLKVLLGKRNYFTHEYFKYTSYVNATEDFIKEEFDAIKADLIKLKQMLERLNLIKNNQETRIKYLIEKNKLKKKVID